MRNSVLKPLCCLLGVAWLVFAPYGGRAQGKQDNYGPKPTREKDVQARYKEALKAHKGNSDKLVLSGLVADRKAKTVEVLAESTGLKADDIAEFLLVGHDSDRGYEALLWAFAKPSDVHRALTFIGVQPGTPCNPATFRFWATGDKVVVRVRSAEGESFPIERLVRNTEVDATLPEEGFVFSGSMMVPSQDGTGEPRYGADLAEARPVASTFNDPVAVLDVPRQLDRSEVYGKQVVNAETLLPAGELVTLVMTPGDTDGKKRARTLVLSMSTSAVSNSPTLSLAETDGTILRQDSAITPVLETLVALAREGVAVHVALSLGSSLPLHEARKFCTVMAMLESMGGVRIEPPAEGQLYYRAFVPDTSWLTPEGRPSQPWELHLRKKGGSLAGQLVMNEEIWSEDKVPVRSYKRKSFDVADSKAFGNRLEKDAKERKEAGRGLPPNVILVFGAPAMTYGETVAFLAPVLKSNKTVYVFPAAVAP